MSKQQLVWELPLSFGTAKGSSCYSDSFLVVPPQHSPSSAGKMKYLYLTLTLSTLNPSGKKCLTQILELNDSANAYKIY